MDNTTTKLDVKKIGEGLAKYRIVDPVGERRMFDSMKEIGQLSPVVVAEAQNGSLELLDGFKRLHAAMQLPGMESLFAHVLAVNGYAQKAFILKLNWKSGHLRIFEEANIIQSLHREDGLEQLAIAKLLGRHPSWVCRRLSLAEHLHEEVKSYIAVGLLPSSFGREMAKLPRGNQEEVLRCLVKHSFSRKETEKLVRHLLSAPRWSWSKILYYPWDLIHRVDLERPQKKPASLKKNVEPDFENKLSALETLCSEIAQLAEQVSRVPGDCLTRLQHAIERLRSCVESILKQREREKTCLPF
jgi:ParB/RepB/Spo0J family partition protein